MVQLMFYQTPDVKPKRKARKIFIEGVSSEEAVLIDASSS